ncbi:MAG: hypothetical protein ACOC2E_09815 [Bacteroidota bacterium]
MNRSKLVRGMQEEGRGERERREVRGNYLSFSRLTITKIQMLIPW